jgi:hypothetical protein
MRNNKNDLIGSDKPAEVIIAQCGSWFGNPHTVSFCLYTAKGLWRVDPVPECRAWAWGGTGRGRLVWTLEGLLVTSRGSVGRSKRHVSSKLINGPTPTSRSTST